MNEEADTTGLAVTGELPPVTEEATLATTHLKKRVVKLQKSVLDTSLYTKDARGTIFLKGNKVKGLKKKEIHRQKLLNQAEKDNDQRKTDITHHPKILNNSSTHNR